MNNKVVNLHIVTRASSRATERYYFKTFWNVCDACDWPALWCRQLRDDDDDVVMLFRGTSIVEAHGRRAGESERRNRALHPNHYHA